MSSHLLWLQQNAGPGLALRTFSIDAIEDALPGYHECSASLRVGRTWYVGHGQAKTQTAALAKAAGEAIERWLFARVTAGRRGVTSSGFAVHPVAARAESNARRELVERDLFLCHMLTGTPFNPIPARVLEAHDESRRMRAYLDRRGIELRLGELPSETGVSVVICAAFGRRFRPAFGAVVGMGAHARLDRAMTKAVLECWGGLLAVLFQGPQPTLSRAAFRRLPAPNVDDHYHFAMHAEGGRSLRPMFADAMAVTVERRASPRFTTRVWSPLPRPFESCPIVGARSTSEELQPLFFGLPSAEKLRMDRLERFCANRGLRLGRLRRGLIHHLP